MSKVSMVDIRRRLNTYKRGSNINIEILAEQCRKSSSVSILESCCGNFEDLNTNNEQAFTEIIGIVKEFCTNPKSNASIVNTAIDTLSREVLPRVNNMKIAKSILEEVAIELPVFTPLIEETKTFIACDRVINNHVRLLERYNIDKIIKETNLYSNDNIQDCILELCSLIDTYTMPFNKKYTIALENIMYGLEKNRISYDRKFVLESITDYFLCVEEVTDERIKTIEYVLQETPFYTTEDSVDINLSQKESVVNEDTGKIIADKKNQAKEYLDKLKASKDKSPSVLQSIVRKMYTKSTNNIIEETPNFLIWIRTSVVVGTLAIAPLVGLVTIAVDQYIAMGLKRKETDKILKDLTNQKKSIDAKIEKSKNDKSKERMIEYSKVLKINIDKVDNYNRDLHTEKENDEKDEASRDESTSIEARMESYLGIVKEIPVDEELLKETSLILELEEEVTKFNEDSSADILDILEQSINVYNEDGIDTIVEFSMTNSNILDLEHLESILSENARFAYSKNKVDYRRTSCLKENMGLLKNYKKSTVDSMNMHEAIESLKSINEVISSVNEISYYSRQPVNEIAFGNSIKLAQEKMRKAAVKLSDKDKSLSRTLDNSLGSFYSKVQVKMTNQNREAVIKGSIIPSASVIIKGAMVASTVALVAPSLAVIGVLGTIALSKVANLKEKQYILDEIEIQIKLVTKKIQIAENNNDTKSLEQLLKIEQQLKREKTRIQYNMKNYHPIERD